MLYCALQLHAMHTLWLQQIGIRVKHYCELISCLYLCQSVFVDNYCDLALARGSAITLKIFHVREDLKVKPHDQETTVSPIGAGLQCGASVPVQQRVGGVW